MGNYQKQFRKIKKEIKEKFNLDSVTIIHTSKQHDKENKPYKKHRFFIKMKYKMKNGEDIISFCPIAYIAIEEMDLISSLCKENLLFNPEIRSVVRGMQANAIERSKTDN